MSVRRVALLLFLVASCATPPEPVPPSAAPRPVGPRVAHRFTARFLRADGTVLAEPAVIVADGDTGRIEVVTETPYVRDVDVATGGGTAGGDRAAPVEGKLALGLSVSFLAETRSDRPGEIAVAFDVAASRTVGVAPRRTLRIGPPPAEGVEVEFPRVETTAFAGARRLQFGPAVKVASFPADGGDVTLELRADVVPGTVDAAPADAGVATAPSLLSTLLRAAADGAPVVTIAFQEEGGTLAGRICGTGADVGEVAPTRGAAPALVVPEMPWRALATVSAPGAHVERRLDVAHVAGYEARGGSADPVVATHTSGCDVTFGDDGKFHVRWTAAPEFLPRRLEPVPGMSVDVDRPMFTRAAAATPVVPGETEIPVGSFASTTGAIVRLSCTAGE
jgi:hypothetical protein